MEHVRNYWQLYLLICAVFALIMPAIIKNFNIVTKNVLDNYYTKLELEERFMSKENCGFHHKELDKNIERIWITLERIEKKIDSKPNA